MSGFTFLKAASPKSPAEYEATLGAWSISTRQLEAFERLELDITRFIRLSPEVHLGSGRGLKNIHLLVKHFTEAWGLKEPQGANSLDVNSLVCSALEVNPDRIAVPEQAGQVLPESILRGKRCELFQNLDFLAVPDLDRLPEPVPCYMVAPHNEVRIRELMLSHGMAVLIQEDTVARRTDGRLLLGGMFCVAHKELPDRLIFDRRPQNASEARCPWAGLPMGPMLGKLRLRSHEGLRGSGDDLRTYFYQLRRHGSGLARNAFGRRIPGTDVTEYGGQPCKSYRPALWAVGMGDNAVDFSQEVHVRLLKDFGLCQDATLLRYGKPLPKSGLLEGVYIDDHLVLLKGFEGRTATPEWP